METHVRVIKMFRWEQYPRISMQWAELLNRLWDRSPIVLVKVRQLKEKNLKFNQKTNYADSRSSSPILTPSTLRTKGLYPSLTANISKWMSSIWMLGSFHTWMFVLEQLCSKTESSHESSDILTIVVVTFFEDIAVTTIEQSRVCEFQRCCHYIDDRILINEVVECEPTSSLNEELSFFLNS